MPQIVANADTIAAAQAAASALNNVLPEQPAIIILDSGVALYDFHRWYENRLPEHPLPPELELDGMTLLLYNELDPDAIEELSQQLDCFPNDPEHFEPRFRDEPEIRPDWPNCWANASFRTTPGTTTKPQSQGSAVPLSSKTGTEPRKAAVITGLRSERANRKGPSATA